MSDAARDYRRESVPTHGRLLALTVLVTGAAFALLAVALVSGSNFRILAAALAVVVVATAFRDHLFAWHSLVALTILVILVVPIRRYTLPTALPFNLELYRVVIAAVALAWLSSLLIDPRVRFRRSGLEAPLTVFVVTIMLSILANLSRVHAAGSIFTKSITFFLSFLVFFYVIVTVVRRPREIDFLVRTLVVGGAVLGVLAIVERRTGYNAFNHLRSVLPFLEVDWQGQNASDIERGGRLRVYGSAQHPIALGAVFAVLLPLALYRARVSGQRRWWLALVLIGFGLLTAQSRTAILMLLALAAVFLALYPKDMIRLWPLLLVLPFVVHYALPGTLGTIKDSFFPHGGLIAEQSNAPVGSGRLSTLPHVLETEFLPNPILGEGFATRITGTDAQIMGTAPAPITDNQWLSLLLQTGVAGALAFLWLAVRTVRRLGGAAKRDPSARGWMLAASAASITAYAVGMFTFDSFSFIQVTFLFFIVLAIGMATLLTSRVEWEGCAGELFGQTTVRSALKTSSAAS
jgi:hypothetical protein